MKVGPSCSALVGGHPDPGSLQAVRAGDTEQEVDLPRRTRWPHSSVSRRVASVRWLGLCEWGHLEVDLCWIHIVIVNLPVCTFPQEIFPAAHTQGIAAAKNSNWLLAWWPWLLLVLLPGWFADQQCLLYALYDQLSHHTYDPYDYVDRHWPSGHAYTV